LYSYTVPFTVQFYKRARIHSGKYSFPREIGINLYKPFSGLQNLYIYIIKYIFQKNLVMQYSSPGGDFLFKNAIAALLNLAIEQNIFAHDDIFFVNGSGEALEFFFSFLRRQHTSLLLPLPGYFKYDLLSHRKSIAVGGYYNLKGHLFRLLPPPYTLIINNPNAITGTVYPDDFFLQFPTKYILYDISSILLDFHNRKESWNFLVGRLQHSNWEKSILLFSPSKDLSIPAFRSGCLVTKNEELKRFVKMLITERYFSISPIVMYSMVLYFVLVLYRYKNKSNINKIISSILRSNNLDIIITSAKFFRDFDMYMDGMIDHFYENFQIIYDKFADFFDTPFDIRPSTGFSSLFPLSYKVVDEISADITIELATSLAKDYHINLYPSYMYGGTPDAWATLYGPQLYLRLNVSMPTTMLLQWLFNLRQAIPATLQQIKNKH